MDKDAANKLLIIFIIAALITAAIVITAKIIIRKKLRYSLKGALLSKTEAAFFDAIKRVLADKYLIYPQINLATVINKDSGGFRNELFRNLDFCIFDYNFKPLVAIEINDNSHLRKDRIERDKSVNKICKIAGLPLVTFWVKDGINYNCIYNSLKKYLS